MTAPIDQVLLVATVLTPLLLALPAARSADTGRWLLVLSALPAFLASLLVSDGATLELPWTTFFRLEYDRVMGEVPRSRFGGEFPIRFDYLDTIEGGDLSIQVHPTTAYVRSQFGEPYHQGEMYYIMVGREGATVNLGVNEETDRNEFLRAAQLADQQGIAQKLVACGA